MTSVSEQIWQILFYVDNTFLLVSRKILLAMVSTMKVQLHLTSGMVEKKVCRYHIQEC